MKEPLHHHKISMTDLQQMYIQISISVIVSLILQIWSQSAFRETYLLLPPDDY